MDLWDERWSHELVVLTAQRRPPQQGLSFVPSTLTSLALPVCGNLTRRMWGGGREHRGGRPRSWPEESWHSPAANILTSSWAQVHSLPPSGCTEGNKRFCSRFQSARERAGCFSCEHQCVYFPVSVVGEVAMWTLLWEWDHQGWNSGGKGEFSPKQLCTNTGPSFQDEAQGCCFEAVMYRVFPLGSQFVQHIRLIYNKIFQENMQSHEWNSHPAWKSASPPKEGGWLFSEGPTVSAPRCSAGSRAPSACPVPSAEEVPRQTGSSSS